MKKFRIIKHFSLDFLGDSWKEAYIDFNALTVADVKDKFSALSKMGEDSKNVTAGLITILSLLQDKFIEGKGVGEKGELVPIDKEDLEALPVETLSKALSFLSQGVTSPSPQQ